MLSNVVKRYTDGLCDYGFYRGESPQCEKRALFVLARVAYGDHDVDVVYFCEEHKVKFENDDPYEDYNFTVRELPKNKS